MFSKPELKDSKIKRSKKDVSRKFFQRASLASHSHRPYWDVEECEKAGRYASTSNKTRQALENLRRQHISRRLKLKNFYDLTLSEALQARTEIAVRLNFDGIFSGKLETRHTLQVYYYTLDKYGYKDEVPYKVAESIHKNRNPHHPDCLRRKQEWWETYETCLDLLSSAYRISQSPLDAFEMSWGWMCESRSGFYVPRVKFSHMSPLGILVYLVMVERHGLSREHLDSYRQSSSRFRQMYPDDPDLLEAYADELHFHAALVNVELARLNIKARHDKDKFFTDIMLPYAKKWCNQYIDETIFDLSLGMSSDELTGVASNALSASLADPATQENITSTLSRVISPQLDQMSTLFTQVGNSAETFTSSAEKFNEVLGSMHASIKPIIDQSSGTLSKMDSVLEVMQQFVGSYSPSGITKCIPFLEYLPRGVLENISMPDILYIIQLYVLYANSASWVLRASFLTMGLHRLGILDKFMEITTHIYGMLKEFCVETDDADSAPSSFVEFVSGIFENVNARTCAIISCILTFILCGVKMKWKDMSLLGDNIMGTLKNVALVGIGFLGMSRLFNVLTPIYEHVISWIREHVFKIPDKQPQLVIDIRKWAVRVNFFSTEEGMTLIRSSDKALDEAKKLHPEGLRIQTALINAQYTDQKFDREERALVNSLLRKTLVIQNAIFRILNYTEFQKTMFHIQLVGQPGIGKSTMTSSMVDTLSTRLHPSVSKNNLVYSLGDTDHFDGYAGQKFIIGDDLWKYNDAKHCTTIISLITNTPVLLPMAHLEEKGTYLTSDIMISSVNAAYPKITDILCEKALYRRRHCLIEVKIDNDVLDPATQKYDGARWERKYAGCDKKTFPHLQFSFLKPVPDFKEQYEIGVIPRDDSISFAGASQYYSESDSLPDGLVFPLKELTWQQMMEKVESRYRAMRREESSMGIGDKKQAMDINWMEIDSAIDFYYNGAPTSEHMYAWYMPPDSDVAPTQAETSLLDSVKQAKPVGDSLNDIVSDLLSDLDNRVSADTVETMESSVEDMRRERILRMRNRTMPEQRAPEVEDVMTLMREFDGRKHLRLSMSYSGAPLQNFIFKKMTTEDNCRFMKFLDSVRLAINRYKTQKAGDNSIGRLLSRSLNVSSDPIFSQGSSSAAQELTIDFVNRLRYENGEWYYDVEHDVADIGTTLTLGVKSLVDLIPAIVAATKYTLVDADSLSWRTFLDSLKQYREDLKDFRIINPYDLDLEDRTTIVLTDGPFYYVTNEALLLASDPIFIDMSRVFLDSFNLEQQKRLTQYGSLLTRVLPTSITTSSWYQKITTYAETIVLKFKRFAYWFWNMFVCDMVIMRTLVSTAIALLIVQTIKGLGSLFTIKEVPSEETSKVLHKTQIGRRPLYGIQHTHSLAKNAEFGSILKRNTRMLRSEYGGFNAISSGQFMYTVWHGVRKLMEIGDDFELELLPTNAIQKEMITIPVRVEDVIHYPDSDFCVIYSPHFPESRNIDKYLVMASDLTSLSGCELAHLYVTETGMQTRMTTPVEFKPVMDVATSSGFAASYLSCLKVTGMSLSGSSGGPIVTTAPLPAPRIVCGIQSFNKDPCAYVQCVTQEMVAMCKAKIRPTQPIIELEGPLICDETSSSPKEKLIDSHLDVCGVVPKEFIAGCVSKTKFVKTVLASEFPTDSVPAILNGRDPLIRENNHPYGSHPLTHSVNKSGRDVMRLFDDGRVEQAVDDIAEYMAWKLNYPKLRLMDLKETLMGHDHPGSGPIDLTTSTGLPWVADRFPNKKKGKREYLEFYHDNGYSYYYFDKEVQETLFSTEDAMKQGFIPANSLYEFPKDELRPKPKAHGDGLTGQPMKTRSVTVMSMVHAMLFRKYHLDLTSRMHVAADGDFQSCVGINPDGPEWTNLFSNLYQMSPKHCFDIDVGNWDGHMTPQIFWAVTKIVNRLYGDDDFSESGKLRFAISHNAVFGYDQWEDLLFKKLRGMPSGFGGTAIYNTIAHMLVFYLLYLELADISGHRSTHGNFSAYLSHVSVFFYGDDVVGSFHPSIVEWFDANKISALYSHYGWPTTSASKSGAQVDFKSIWEVQFLKRHFVLDDDYGQFIIHPKIDETVIMNLLHWMRVNSRTCIPEQLQDNIGNAMALAMPYGQKYYEDLRRRINRELSAHKILPYLVSYRTMRDALLRARFDV